MLHAVFAEKFKTHFMLHKYFFENCAVYEMCGKICNSGQATDNSIICSVVYACNKL